MIVLSEIGTCFRYLRKSKNMTINDTAKGILTPQFLSEFERGNSNISTTKFFALLNKINVQITEFKLHSEELTEGTQQSFLAKYAQAYDSRNIVKLNELIDLQTQLYQMTNNERHQHNVIILKQRINNLAGIPYDGKDTKIVFQYLINCDEWNYYEVCLFGNSVFFMGIAQVEKLSLTAYKRSLKYEELLLNSSNFALVMMNVITYFLSKNHFEPVAALFNDVDSVLEGQDYFYDKNQLNYLKGIYKIKTGAIEDGVSMCQEAIRLMSHFGASDIANILQIELDDLLK